MSEHPRPFSEPLGWGGLRSVPIEQRRPPTRSRFTDERRAFLAPYHKALREIALPPVVNTLTPSEIASLLGWDEIAAVTLVPMTDDEAEGPVQSTRVGTGERKLRTVM